MVVIEGGRLPFKQVKKEQLVSCIWHNLHPYYNDVLGIFLVYTCTVYLVFVHFCI